MTGVLRYGVVAVPTAFAGFPLYILAPDFFAVQHGVSLGVLGALLLLIRLFDAVQDPLIGWLADRMHRRFALLLWLAGSLLCLSIFGLFNTVYLSPALWFVLCMVTAVSAYSVLVIVLGAQATLWTEDSGQQTRIAGAREAFALLGVLLAVSFPSLFALWTDDKMVYLWYSAALAVMMFAALISYTARSRPAPAQDSAAAPPAGAAVLPSPLSALRALPSQSWRLLAVYALSMLASSMPAVLLVFYVRDLLGAPQLTGVFLLLYFLAGAAGMPLWRRLSERLGKFQAWILAIVVAVSAFVFAFFLGPGDVWQFAAVCLISGLALGADLTLPPSLLADQVHRYGNRAFAASHYALLAFTGKLSLALASALTLLVLNTAGFVPQSENSDSALAALSLCYALLPCVLKLGAAALLYCFFIRPGSGAHHEHSQIHRNHRSSHHA